MFDETPDLGPITLARGAPTTFGDLYGAAVESGRKVDNIMAGVAAREKAYDDRIDAIRKATGIELTNPIRDWQLPGLGPSRGDRMAAFDERIKGLEQQFPEHVGVIRGTISPDMEAREGARRAERAYEDMASRYDGWAWVPGMLGGFRASFEDPANLAALMAGPWGRAGQGAAGVFWMGVKSGAANMAVEAASQPVVQKWRADAGLDYGISRAATQVAAAGVFGFGLDAGLRGTYRVIQHSRGREAILDPAGNVMGYRAKGAPEDALEEAAKEAAPSAMIRKAADGDIDAIHSVARDAGVSTDPAIRGARAAAEIEREIAPKLPEGLDPEDGFERAVQAMRAAIDHREPLPVAAPPLAKPRPDLADDTAMPAGRFSREGKPVTLERLDPRTITTDPEAFQFKRGGDGQGEIGTLAGVETWDPMASNRVIVYERTDGTRVIADGHQRLGLARRLADQQPILDGFVMREADGWTVADVRAYAAQKNLKEGSGSIVDAATVIRERPDIIDGSVPLNNGAMRQARALSRLSAEAFGQVVAGNVDPAHAALVADLVGNRDLHAGFVDELVKARPDNLRQARIMIGDMLEAGNALEVQETLFGLASFQRPMMAERAAVLDRALKTLGEDAKIFGLVDREAERLRGAGNRIARGNAERALQAENLGEIVERLARRAGPVSDWLGDAARAVDAGMKPADAAAAFVDRLRREIGEGGLAALEREQVPRAGLDDPGAKGTKDLTDAMEARFDLLIKDMKRAVDQPDAPNRDQEVMFAIAERRGQAGGDDGSVGRSMRADLDALGYFSKALEAAKAWPQTKGTPEQALMWLKKSGVKDAEIEATGVAKAFEGQKSVTRDDVVKHLTENRVGLGEARYQLTDDPMSGDPAPGAAGLPKWNEYSLDPSNPTYRETVLHLPLNKGTQTFEEFVRAKFGKGPDDIDPTARRIMQSSYDIARQDLGASNFNSGHFSEPNIVGHMMTSMTKHEGKPVYTIDQIQSDWGQKLRDGGVRDDAKISALKTQISDLQQRYWKARAGSDVRYFATKEAAEKWARENTKGGAGIFGTDKWKTIGDDIVALGDFSRGYKGFVSPDDGAKRDMDRLRAELNTAEAATPGNPLVNTTDQWTTTTLRRALRQAAEADAEFIAIPTGDTVLSYNPGDDAGMRGFYGSRTSEGIVPKNLRKLLEKLDKDAARPIAVDQLETPTSGMKGQGFTLFPLTDKVKRAVIEEGQPLFAAMQRRAATDAALLKGEFGHTARATADMAGIRADVEAAVRRVAPRDVGIRMRDAINEYGGGVEGFFDPHERMIHIALTAADPLRVGLEEAGHALKRAGLFTAEEYRLLTDYAARHKLREAFDIDGRYADIYGKRWEGDEARIEAAMIEETVMQMLARHAAGERWGTPAEQGVVARLVERFWKVIDAVRSALGARGIRTVDDVFRAFETGEIGARRGDQLVDQFARSAEGRAGLSMRGLVDPQMRTPGRIDAEPFDLAAMRVVGRSEGAVPIASIRTVQDTVSVAGVKAKMRDATSDDGRLPSVFKVGETYYVNDGNHRITAARLAGDERIRAEVIELAPRAARGADAARPDDAPAQRAAARRDHPNVEAARTGVPTGEIPAFHGTAYAEGVARAGDGGVFWATTSPGNAATYADRPAIGQARMPNIAPVFIELRNPIVVDGRGAAHDAIPFEGRIMTTRAIAAAASERGYDGVVFRNVRDGADVDPGAPATTIAALGRDTVRAAYDPDHVWFSRARQQVDGIKDAADLVGACKHG